MSVYQVQVVFGAEKMPEFTIAGIPVSFPFEPYNVQRRYMEKVIECLDRSTNSVLESPTGLTFNHKKKNVIRIALYVDDLQTIRYWKNT